MSKHRITVRMDDGEAAVVAPLIFWERLEEWFLESAKEFPEEKQGWLDAADHISKWVAQTRIDDNH